MHIVNWLCDLSQAPVTGAGQQPPPCYYGTCIVKEIDVRCRAIIYMRQLSAIVFSQPSLPESCAHFRRAVAGARTVCVCALAIARAAYSAHRPLYATYAALAAAHVHHGGVPHATRGACAQVQGVFFRKYTKDAADRLGIAGKCPCI
jgi:Acylphosphatase